MLRHLMLLTLLLLFVTAPGASAQTDGRTRYTETISLTAVGSDTDAQGSVFISYKEKQRRTEQILRVSVSGLASRTTYTLTIDGAAMTTFTTNRRGRFDATFTDRPNEPELPLPATFLPVIKLRLVEIREMSGQVLLSGILRAGGNNSTVRVLNLTNTGVDTDAFGKAETEVELNDDSPEQEFEVELENLTAFASYRLIVNGAEIATLTADALGKARIKYSTDPKVDELLLPSSLLPVTNIREVNIISATGQVLLRGNFDNASGGGGGTGGGNSLQVIFLTNTGVNPRLIGKAEKQIDINDDSPEEEFEVEVENLAPATVVRLFVNGSELNSMAANSVGKAKLKYSTRPKADELPLPATLRPLNNIRTVEVLSLTGQVLLRGSF